ncbi:MAG TPA: hypothetical protein VE573_15530 [Nitrososphaeraceae archaeon]|nr:hypothetical protein [Nitrososphaeraceae archaeon]
MTNDIFIPEDKITLSWNDPKGYQQALVQTKPQVFKSAKTAADNVLSDVFNWIKKIFRKAFDKLKELAEKILDLAKNFGISVRDMLSRMQKFIFRWVITYSALPSVVINDDKTSVTLGLNKITTSSSLEFARSDLDLNVIENIIGILKIIPSISIKVDAEYSSPGSQSKSWKQTNKRKAKT